MKEEIRIGDKVIVSKSESSFFGKEGEVVGFRENTAGIRIFYVKLFDRPIVYTFTENEIVKVTRGGRR